MGSTRKRGGFVTTPEKLPVGTTGKLLWGKFMDAWPEVPPGAHAAVELPGGSVAYVPICYLAGPCGESLVWV